MFGEIRPEGSTVKSEEDKRKAREYAAAKRAERKAMALASGDKLPREPRKGGFNDPANWNTKGRPKSFINSVTEYGATFNKMNEEAISTTGKPLTTAMQTLIMAMNSDQLDMKEKAKIAEKLAAFESSRAPIISIEHVQNIAKDEEISADDALDEFLESLRKV